ncbi:MAG: ribbon-helix-helix protein, CopG family [Armatimonadetes bacterium]|nr:ribbon-helix-helix protein, CopG family [Armatimonadota bacterium]
MGNTQFRTQIYLPLEVHQKLERLARRTKHSKASIIREALEYYFASHEAASWEGDPLASLGEIPWKSGISDGSVRHDHYLYGDS